MLASNAVLTLGYVALADAAPLLVADELGLFGRQGLRVALQLVPSWASVRDRLAFGALHGSQMLSPMPIAAALGLGGVQADLRVVATLSLNGNTATLGNGLWQEIGVLAPDLAAQYPLPAAALARVAARRRMTGVPLIRLAVVFPFSSHNYLLRDWLAEGGIDPDQDLELTAIAPALVADALAEGRVDGFCAGEPWGSHAQALGVGRIAWHSAQRWPGHPEKVLGVTHTLLDNEPDQVAALVAAVITAGRWLDDPANHPSAARILRDRALDLPLELIERCLAAPSFHHGHANQPYPEHQAAWLRQMRRWGHVPANARLPVLWDGSAWNRAAQLLADPPRLVSPTWPAQPNPDPVAREDA